MIDTDHATRLSFRAIVPLEVWAVLCLISIALCWVSFITQLHTNTPVSETQIRFTPLKRVII